MPSSHNQKAQIGTPVDRRPEHYQPSPYNPRRIIPSGDVNTYGTRSTAEPSTAAKVVVWGGAGLITAAATAAAILTVRKVADLVTGNDDIDRDAEHAARKARERVWDNARDGKTKPRRKSDRPHAPAFADMSERERGDVRHRADLRLEQDDAERARQREQARRTRRPAKPAPRHKSFLHEIEDNATRLTTGVNGVVGSLSAAMAGFRLVASQAEGILKEFHTTADSIRSFLDNSASRDRQRRAGTAERPRKSDMVDLRDDPTDPDPERTHKL